MFNKVLLPIILITLSCWLVLVPIANSISLPLGNTHGIISRVVIQGRSPLTNVAIYLLLVLLPTFVVLLLEFLKVRKKHFTVKISYKITSIFRSFRKAFLRVIKNKIFLPIFLLFLVTCWLLNITQPMLSPGLAQDGFHYGEKIGLSEAFLINPKNFYNKAYLMIHGFALNVLPGTIGFFIGGYNLDIAFSFLVIYGQFLFAIIFSFLVLFEISAYISEENRWKVFFLLSLVYFSLYGSIFTPIDRDTIFFLQAFITVRWIRLFTKSNARDEDFLLNNRLIYPILIGCLIPISVFYVYDRATYFILLFVYLFVYIAIVKSKKFFLKSGLFALISILLTSIFLSLIFGFNSLPVSLAQILYWSKVSGLFTSLPYPEIKLVDVLTWLPILVQSLAITILCLKFRTECVSLGKPLKAFLSENGVPIFILLCAVMFMRVALGRSDGGHLVSPGFFAIFAFAAILGKPIAEQKTYRISWLSTFIVFLFVCSLINMNSVSAAVNVSNILKYPSSVNSLLSNKSSDLINTQYKEAANQIKNDIGEQSCFYTLTSEGIWYRIFRLRPCSKYWYLIYSTSTASQQELVKELQNEKPRIILYSNQSLGNGIDGVPKETSHLLVHQYIWQNYRPYKYINDNWFWIRRDTEVQLSDFLVTQPNNIVGSFDNLSALDSNNKLDAIASGWTLLPPNQISHENAIFLTYNLVESPNEIKLLAIGSASIARPDVATAINNSAALQSGWNISFNKLNIPPKIVNIRAWAYNSTDQKLYEIPSSSVKTIEGK